MDAKEIVTVMVQTGALGLLFFLAVRVPQWVKQLTDARKEELALHFNDRAALIAAFVAERKALIEAFTLEQARIREVFDARSDKIIIAIEKQMERSGCRYPHGETT